MRFSISAASMVAVGALAGQVNAAIQLDLTSDVSIKNAAATAAFDMMSFYTGNRTGDVPGNLPDPYYWWECGAMFGTMLNYVYYTGDTSYNDAIMGAMLHQAGPNNVYMPKNQSRTLGNDDQGFWGLAAMTAAETNFVNPPEGSPQWLALAQGVFNTQAERWSEEVCGGGLRWQIFSFNNGYTYKNSISNGCFFNLAARLALYTGNQTYADWAAKTWDWMEDIGLMSSTYEVFDGTQDVDNCTSKDHNQWTYNNGVFILGAAAMFNFTEGDQKWRTAVDGLTAASKKFFINDIMYEPCEASGKCNVDQRSFKAYLTRWLAATAKLVPHLHDNIIKEIETSAKAAVQTCTAGASGTQCGLRWTEGPVNDGSIGVGEQMAVLEIIQSNLVDRTRGWASARAGTGTSKGDVEAGTGSRNRVEEEEKFHTTITTGDRIGAGVLTALMLIGVLGGSATMIMSE